MECPVVSNLYWRDVANWALDQMGLWCSIQFAPTPNSRQMSWCRNAVRSNSCLPIGVAGRPIESGLLQVLILD